MNRNIEFVASLWVVLAAACGSAMPTQELLEARKVYQRVSESEVKRLNPRDLHLAREALEAAEQAHRDGPGSAREADLAYIAQRKAQLAMVRAGGAMAEREKLKASSEYTATLEGRVQQATAERDSAKVALQKTSQELSAEREARLSAENQLRAALQSLKELASIKEESRGLVITLSGSVLFKTGSAELLTVAQQKLNQVAQALAEYGSEQPIIIEGHTDSRGSDRYNLDLSQRRADSVRTYLLSRGLEADQVRAVGKGESTPIANNRSAEGRANNRRVEIVVPGQQG